MNRFRLPDMLKEAVKVSPVPFAIYEFAEQKVKTVALSKGFLDLFCLKSYEEAVQLLDRDMYRDAHPDDVARIADLDYKFVANGEEYSAVYRNKTSEQKDYHIIHADGRRIHLQGKDNLFVVWYMDETQDMAGDKSRVEKMMHSYITENIKIGVMARQNRYDDLTGLPNMTYFLQLAEEGKKQYYLENKEPVILYMDFSNMKIFNDRHGFTAGDTLLREFGKLLRRTFGTEQAGRFSGDHFAAFTDSFMLKAQLDTLFDELKKVNHGNVLPLRVGIYADSFEPVPTATACDRAKIACDSERGSFRSHHVYYNSKLHEQTAQREYVFNHFKEALKKDWIRPYFQPIVDSKTGEITDEEALARWISPTRGMIRPDQFIPVLEDAGLLYKLDLYMIQHIIEAMQAKREAGIKLVPVSLNLSLNDFRSCQMREKIETCLKEAGIDKKYITIEITERALGQDPELLRSVIDDFHKAGFTVWLDDFGSEYSSLNIVDEYPFELFKLDMKFIRRLGQNKISRYVIECVIELTKKIGIETVAEGVETEEHAEFLRQCGCTKQQGYLYSKPLPLADLLALYQNKMNYKSAQKEKEECVHD
ncbi:EAL domain-containing protein [Mitsuokella sp.]|uniref:EAL domain-containing protein n=1 Tax=Mitsuokella sp. TaxID=2049034 RepID=UPI003D7D26A9